MFSKFEAFQIKTKREIAPNIFCTGGGQSKSYLEKHKKRVNISFVKFNCEYIGLLKN